MTVPGDRGVAPGVSSSLLLDPASVPAYHHPTTWFVGALGPGPTESRTPHDQAVTTLHCLDGPRPWTSSAAGLVTPGAGQERHRKEAAAADPAPAGPPPADPAPADPARAVPAPADPAPADPAPADPGRADPAPAHRPLSQGAHPATDEDAGCGRSEGAWPARSGRGDPTWRHPSATPHPQHRICAGQRVGHGNFGESTPNRNITMWSRKDSNRRRGDLSRYVRPRMRTRKWLAGRASGPNRIRTRIDNGSRLGPPIA